MVKFSHKFKSFLVAVFFLGSLAVLLIRLFFLQVVWHDFFLEKASQQQRYSLTLPSKRGKILDRKGLDLAVNVPVKSFYGVPLQIKEPRKIASKLAQGLSLDEKDLFRKLSGKKGFVWIKRKVSESEAAAVINQKIKGIYVLEESKRVYPGHQLLSHVLGFTNLDDEGLEGLELVYNEYLKGKPGWKFTERDAEGRDVLTSKRYEVDPRDGFNLVLTVDAAIQTLTESELDKVMEKFEPQSASILVMDPKSGEILALANRPAYDLNEASKISADKRRNRIVTDFFEPGSTFKPFVASAALQEGAVKISDQFFCENGSFQVAGHVIHDVHPNGTLSVSEIIAKSSNIGMGKIGYRLGSGKLFEYVKKFGFGEKTGLELPGEISGWVHPLSKWSKLTPYMVSMGQEVTVTTLQLVRAYCSLANGGVMVKPRLVKKVVDSDGRVIFEPKVEGQDQVISKEIVSQIVQAMEDVVSSEGTGFNAQVEGYSVAGKTGTAQKATPGGGYSHSKFVSSFVGFLPATDPRVVIAVVLNEPKHFHYGGTVAAPSFKELASSLMRYWEITPDRVIAAQES